MRLSEHFDSVEFTCHCGCGGLSNGAAINKKLVQVLEKMRSILGKPIVISSGYRCSKHNRKVGGVPNSQHCKGTAADIVAYYNNPAELYKAAEQAGADGIGLYEWGVHVDVRGEKSRW